MARATEDCVALPHGTVLARAVRDPMVDAATRLDQTTGRIVLVVEDDPAMCTVLTAHLTREGYDVISEPNAERVVTLVETTAVDVVVVDKEIPGMGGLDLLSLLRRRHPDLPIIVVTAFGGPHVAQEVFRRGASRYLEKPFHISDLVAALRTVTTALQRIDTPATDP